MSKSLLYDITNQSQELEIEARKLERAFFLSCYLSLLDSFFKKDSIKSHHIHNPSSDGSIPVDVIALDQALDRLAALSPRQARVAELRAFAGMSVAEIARALEVSERTVKHDWLVARLWLSRELRATRGLES